MYAGVIAGVKTGRNCGEIPSLMANVHSFLQVLVSSWIITLLSRPTLGILNSSSQLLLVIALGPGRVNRVCQKRFPKLPVILRTQLGARVTY